MILSRRLAVSAALATAALGLTVNPAHATTEPLSADAVGTLAVASCQLDPLAPLSLEEMSPVVVGESDVEVVADEISVHVVRAQVNTSAGDVQECTFGVLHRDAQLKQVQHVGTVSLDRVDSVAGTSSGVETDIELGNMGKRSPIDPTTEVSLGGFLTPLENAVEDPSYTVTLDRKSIQEVQIAANRAEKDAAARLLKVQTKAAATLLKKQSKVAHGKHADKAQAAAQRSYERRIAAAEAAYLKAISPKTISRPVSEPFAVTGTVVAAG